MELVQQPPTAQPVAIVLKGSANLRRRVAQTATAALMAWSVKTEIAPTLSLAALTIPAQLVRFAPQTMTLQLVYQKGRDSVAVMSNARLTSTVTFSVQRVHLAAVRAIAQLGSSVISSMCVWTVTEARSETSATTTISVRAERPVPTTIRRPA